MNSLQQKVLLSGALPASIVVSVATLNVDLNATNGTPLFFMGCALTYLLFHVIVFAIVADVKKS
jgi:uncharacterized membrane protein YhdT